MEKQRGDLGEGCRGIVKTEGKEWSIEERPDARRGVDQKWREMRVAEVTDHVNRS